MNNLYKEISAIKAKLRAEFAKSAEGKKIIARHYSQLKTQADSGHTSQERQFASLKLGHVKAMYRGIL